MKSSKPPALATWLLEHIRFSNTNDVLAGDLLEEFNQRRSAAWYWRQVLMAILVGFASEVRHHRVLAIRAVIITCAANYGAIVLSRVEASRYRLHPALVSHRKAMLFTSAGALLWYAFMAIIFIKKGSLQHSFLQIAVAAIIYYVVALTGFVTGGFLLTPGSKTSTPPSEQY